MRIAYLITFRCYGSWLHSDERGSVSVGRNVYGDAVIEPDDMLQHVNKNFMNGNEQTLDFRRRHCVENTIREVSQHRGWALHAVNIRTNHVHIVVGAEATPEKVMNDYKAYATRRLREQGLLPASTQILAEHGSTVYLWSFNEFEAACDYVLNQQDRALDVMEPEA